jgi:ceroid-lipofuscinosis MFS transporter 7
MQTRVAGRELSDTDEPGCSRGHDTVSSQTPLLERMRPISPTDWRSIYVVYYIMFVSEAARGLVLPSQWSYLAETLQGTKTQLGVLVSIFSLGRMIATVPLGYVSDVWSARLVLAMCCVLAALGSIGYAMASSFASLLVTRILTGVGSATVSVCRAHIARSTSVDERTTHFAYLSAVQFIGFAVLPIAGTAFSMLPRKSFRKIIFDEYRYPAWVLALLNISAIGILFLYYRDPPTRHRESPLTSGGTEPTDIELSTHVHAVPESVATTTLGKDFGDNSSMTTPISSERNTSIDGAVSSEFVLSATTSEDAAQTEIRNAVSRQEAPVAGDSRTLSSSRRLPADIRVDYPLLVTCLLINICFRGVVAIVETVVAPDLIGGEGLSLGTASLDIGVLGVLGLVAYLMLRPLSKRTDDYPLVVCGLALMTLGSFLLMMQSRHNLPLWIYLTALSTIWSLGYPIGQTATLSIFSKVLADLPAGGFLGIFSAAGSLARLVFATLAGLLDEKAGAGAPFALAWLVCATSLALAVFYRYKFIGTRYSSGV